MKIIRMLGGLLGLALIGFLIHEVGWASVRETLGWLGWRYVIVLAYPITWIALNTLGTQAAFPRKPAALSYFKLLQIRLAGESFNSLLPSGYVGGEPLKVKLLARYMSLREATTGILVAKAAQSVALVIFVSLGLTLGRDGSIFHHRATMIALGLLTLGIGIFVYLLGHQSFSALGRFLHRLTGHPWLQAQEQRLKALDESLGAFYREGKSDFAMSTVWHLGGWLAGALEVALIFSLVGHPLPWTQAWFIGALAQLAAIVGLLSPASVGFYEGGHTMAAKLLGLPAALGLGVSLIRRVREMAWNVVGVSLFWRLSKDQPKA